MCKSNLILKVHCAAGDVNARYLCQGRIEKNELFDLGRIESGLWPVSSNLDPPEGLRLVGAY